MSWTMLTCLIFSSPAASSEALNASFPVLCLLWNSASDATMARSAFALGAARPLAVSCTCIDDIARMDPSMILLCAEKAGLDVTIGLVNRIFHYATEDVARIKRLG